MRKVLIVDDNPDICTILQKRLEENGFIVQCVNSGLALLGSLRSEEEPHALILDLVLPERTGVDLLYALRCKWKNVKVFVFSGYDKYKYEEPFKEYIHGFFSKGEGADKLIEAIKNEFL